MKTNILLFWIICAFYLAATVMYLIWTIVADGQPGVRDALWGRPCYLGDAHPASHVFLEPHLVVRRSTDPAATGSPIPGKEKPQSTAATAHRRLDGARAARTPSVFD